MTDDTKRGPKPDLDELAVKAVNTLATEERLRHMREGMERCRVLAEKGTQASREEVAEGFEALWAMFADGNVLAGSADVLTHLHPLLTELEEARQAVVIMAIIGTLIDLLQARAQGEAAVTIDSSRLWVLMEALVRSITPVPTRETVERYMAFDDPAEMAEAVKRAGTRRPPVEVTDPDNPTSDELRMIQEALERAATVRR
jgi:hypothetical protein